MAKTEPQKHIGSMFGVCKIEQSRNKKFFFDSLILWIEFIRECAVCATRNIKHRQSRSTNNVFIWYRVCFASPLWYFPKKTRQLFSSVILPFFLSPHNVSIYVWKNVFTNSRSRRVRYYIFSAGNSQLLSLPRDPSFSNKFMNSQTFLNFTFHCRNFSVPDAITSLNNVEEDTIHTENFITQRRD